MPERYFVNEIRDLAGLENERAVLQKAGIETYDALYALLKDEHADEALRLAACHVMYGVSKSADKRRAVPALMAVLRSPNNVLRLAAVRVLGVMGSKRALPDLLDIVANKGEPVEMRVTVINTVHGLHESWAVSTLRQIIFDENEALLVRTEALEWSFPLALDDYINLLSHPVPDLRFWAAFRLVGLPETEDLTPAFDKLDQTVAYDHTLPEHWGWHVDREAVAALERIRFAPYRRPRKDNESDFTLQSYGTRLITPSLEYDRFLRECREWTQGWRYTTKPAPPIQLHIASEWLKSQLESTWAGIAFESLHPVKSAYSLEWVVPIEGHSLIGGLHRDGFTVVCTGNYRAIHPFAAWCRQILQESPLYLYGWASPGILLKPGMTVTEIADAIEHQYDLFQAK